MTLQTVLDSQPSCTQSAASGLVGNWKLDVGRAITLHSRDEGVLRIAKGRLWATTDGPRIGAANDLGDFFLDAGDSLRMGAGQSVVIESWNTCANEAAYFSWDPVPAAQPVNLKADPRWQVAVIYLIRDFGLAMVMAVKALGRLTWGIAGLGEFLVAGRGRVMPRMESNPP